MPVWIIRRGYCAPCGVRARSVATAASEELLQPSGIHPADLAQRHSDVGLHEVLGIGGEDLAQREGVIEVAGADDPERGRDRGPPAPPVG